MKAKAEGSLIFLAIIASIIIFKANIIKVI